MNSTLNFTSVVNAEADKIVIVNKLVAPLMGILTDSHGLKDLFLLNNILNHYLMFLIYF